MAHHLERVATFSKEEVLPFVPELSDRATVIKYFAGHKISLSRIRYRMFALKGTRCVQCGIEGTFFALERHKGAKEVGKEKKYHFNVYAVSSNGKEVMLTVDHIKPKAKGGSNKMKNLQPMCERCNIEKADSNQQQLVFSFCE